ncbi:hypothetical protein [Desulfosporosinus sp. OT]|uniref:hypothetical protein n=1 Tax=Desulfosporosinus sp. OT TaxID=913865 RepID=UPI001A9A1ED8|nr:hypothetical protein [Desulfosporosinus sp. OT]
MEIGILFKLTTTHLPTDHTCPEAKIQAYRPGIITECLQSIPHITGQRMKQVTPMLKRFIYLRLLNAGTS